MGAQEIAASMYGMALRRCGQCVDYHALRGVYRAIGLSGGADANRQEVGAYLTKASAGVRDIMIAGAGDPGLLELVASSCVHNEASVTVVDRCPTPLALCAEFARTMRLNAEVQEADFLSLRGFAKYDLIFGHLILSFIPPEQQDEVLCRWHDLLRPGGQLIIVQRFGGYVGRKAVEPVASDIVKRIKAAGLELPETDAEIAARIDRLKAARLSRTAFFSPSDILERFRQAGFTQELETPLGEAPRNSETYRAILHGVRS